LEKIGWVILDIDGVLLGEKEGFNYPHPHDKVIEALEALQKSGVQVTLCTGKPIYSLEKIVHDAGLCGPHIGDNGSVIYDVLAGKPVAKKTINPVVAAKVVAELLGLGVSLEVHDGQDYYFQNNSITPSLLEKRIHLMHKEPVMADSLVDVVRKNELTKVTAFANSESEKPRVEKIVEKYSSQLSLVWNFVPATNPVQYGMITAKGISKGYAVEQVAKAIGKDFRTALGVGDGVIDWDFISKCRYGCAMGNAAPQLKESVRTKGEGRYMIAPHVDEHGVIEAFRHFGLLK